MSEAAPSAAKSEMQSEQEEEVLLADAPAAPAPAELEAAAPALLTFDYCWWDACSASHPGYDSELTLSLMPLRVLLPARPLLRRQVEPLRRSRPGPSSPPPRLDDLERPTRKVAELDERARLEVDELRARPDELRTQSSNGSPIMMACGVDGGRSTMCRPVAASSSTFE